MPSDPPGASPLPSAAVVIVAAGSGTRVGAPVNKVLLPLRDAPVLAWSLRTVGSLAYVDRIVVVVRRQDADAVAAVGRAHLPERLEAVLVEGGEHRHDSEWRGLSTLRASVEAGDVDVVVVHDAARPLADAALFDQTVRIAHERGGAVPVRPQRGLVTRSGDRHLTGLVGMATPQSFRAGPLLEAYTKAHRDGFAASDTAGCVAAYTDLEIHGVPSPATNLKITFPEDVARAECLLPGLDLV
jgi:2-C-methyl-D-erythritol 4-phosphate cytidylyltransferase